MSFRIALGGPSGPVTLSHVGSAGIADWYNGSPANGTLNIGSTGRQSGDLLVAMVRGYDVGTRNYLNELYSGFTALWGYHGTSPNEIIIAYKISNGSEGTLTVASAADTYDWHCCYVLRPSKAISTVTAVSGKGTYQMTNANPANTVITGTDQTDANAAYLAVGHVSGLNNCGPSQANGTAQQYMPDSGYNPGYSVVRLDNGIPAANLNFDMGDAGNYNCTFGHLLKIT